MHLPETAELAAFRVELPQDINILTPCVERVM
jgi:hypothetical protein